MAREINIYTDGWKATGKNIGVPQYDITTTINWIDSYGIAHTRTETLRFPNFLQTVSANDLKDWMTEMMLREARQRLAVDA